MGGKPTFVVDAGEPAIAAPLPKRALFVQIAHLPLVKRRVEISKDKIAVDLVGPDALSYQFDRLDSGLPRNVGTSCVKLPLDGLEIPGPALAHMAAVSPRPARA